MGTGKSIARAILGALGGGAEYYGDINKQKMLSSDDLYNALARLQMGESLARTNPLNMAQTDRVLAETEKLRTPDPDAGLTFAAKQQIELDKAIELEKVRAGLKPPEYPISLEDYITQRMKTESWFDSLISPFQGDRMKKYEDEWRQKYGGRAAAPVPTSPSRPQTTPTAPTGQLDPVKVKAVADALGITYEQAEAQILAGK